jgi:hypothetical protein
MNPLVWKREHRVALVVISLVGALVGTVFGYTIFALSNSLASAGTYFALWLQFPVYLQWWPWPVFGAAIAGLSFYATRLGSNWDTTDDRTMLTDGVVIDSANGNGGAIAKTVDGVDRTEKTTSARFGKSFLTY